MTEDTKQHHPQFGPSSIGRLMLCPSSVLRNPDTDVSGSGPGAERGTLLHRVALESPQDIELNSFDERAMSIYRDYVEKVTDEPHPMMGEGRVIFAETEETFVIYRQNGEMLTFGTADEVTLFSSAGDGGAQFAHIFDLKTHPTGTIPAYTTKYQGICYALGAFQRWPDLMVVDFHAVAPYGPTFYHLLIERKEVESYLADIEKAVGRAQDALKGCVQVLNPGNEQCTYCPNLAACPATMGTVRSLVSADSGGLDQFLRALNGKGIQEDPKALETFFARFELAKKTLDALGKLIGRCLAKDADALPGDCQLEAKTRKGRSSFLEKPKNKSAFPGRIAKRLRPADFVAATSVSPAKLRDAFIRAYMKEKDCDRAYALEVWELKMGPLLDSKSDSNHIGWKPGAIKPIQDDSALTRILEVLGRREEPAMIGVIERTPEQYAEEEHGARIADKE